MYVFAVCGAIALAFGGSGFLLAEWLCRRSKSSQAERTRQDT